MVPSTSHRRSKCADSSRIDFFEFNGVGLPGYSGGPVIAMDGKIVGVMREAWARQGVKGGIALLMNRAFSVEPVTIIETRVEGLQPTSAR